MNRRDFLTSTAVSALSAPALGSILLSPQQREFRTITYNILACQGYPNRPENRARLARGRSQIPKRIAMELMLYEPDLITFQESAAEEVMAAIAETLEMPYTYFAGGFPGTLMSRHRISDVTNCPLAGGAKRPDDLFTRHWGRAVLRVDDSDLVVYSAHLIPGDGQGIQTREVNAIVEATTADVDRGRSMLFQGDLNHAPDSPFYKRWIEAGWTDTFAEKGEGEEKTFSSTELRWRIDYVFASGPIAEQITACRVLAEGAFIDNASDKTSFPLSDHLPVMASFLL